MTLDEFRELMYEIYVELENLCIENDLYRGLLLEVGEFDPKLLAEALKSAHDDPDVRTEVRERFSDLWTIIERSGLDIFSHEALRNVKFSGKPN